MADSRQTLTTRREFVRTSVLTGLGLLGSPAILRGAGRPAPTVTRALGRTGFLVPTFSLGGQASLQWTGDGIDPIAIIVKAYETGVRYFDTSNVYGPSQLNYGKAFRRLGLTPGVPGYDRKRRQEVFVATKSGIRVNRGQIDGVHNWTQGAPDSTVVDDVRRSLSQLFGDGEGHFPAGAYLDSVQFHAIGSRAEVDAVFDGIESPEQGERVGSLAVLRDLRDGTNHTGMNPQRERLVRHIGISGHLDSDALMYAFQRDAGNLIDTLLVPANANDKRYLSHIHNVIPVAAAKGVGIVSMKVFSDGTFYGKEPRFSKTPEDVVLRVGSPEMDSARLVQYPLSIPGVTTSIIGIGHIDNDPQRCQLMQNFRASQLEEPLDRRELAVTEDLAAQIAGGETNYFQTKATKLGAPRDCTVRRMDEAVNVTWNCALAAGEVVTAYEIVRDGTRIGRIPHSPQTSLTPFAFKDAHPGRSGHRYEVVAIDAAGTRAASPPLQLQAAV